jgi:hypothetical protein
LAESKVARQPAEEEPPPSSAAWHWVLAGAIFLAMTAGALLTFLLK